MPQQSYWPARLILFLGISAFAPASVAQYSVLHSFAEETGDGWFPYSGLTVAGSTIYGTTFDGGDNDGGTIYKLNTDGTAYGVLHSFNGGTTGVGGSRPDAGLTLSGSTLYGTTRQGGAHWSGTLYSINNDGTGFRVLHSFFDNNHPNTRPTFSGTTLYGTTWSTWGGIIYKTNVDGTGYVPLHAFDTERQGGLPQTDLLMSG